MSDHIHARCRAIVARDLGIDEIERVTGKARLKEDLTEGHIDSLRAGLEEEFKITIGDVEEGAVVTFADVVQLVRERLAKEDRT